MPRLIRVLFDKDFDRARDELRPMARRLIEADPKRFGAAGKAIDSDYPQAATRARLLAQHAQYAEALNGQPNIPVAKPQRSEATANQKRGPTTLGCWMPDPNGGDNLRGARLSHAITDFLGTNGKGDLLRPLGASLPKGEREANARRAILLGLAAVDPDATEYLGKLTDLGKAPWVAPAKAKKPVLGRSDVCRWLYESSGHRCLELLREAVGVLVPDSHAMVEGATPTTAKTKPATPVDPITDALARYGARESAGEAALVADPVFASAADHGRRWERAQVAAADAAAPFRAELDKLIAAHPNGYPANSEASKQVEALSWAAREAEAKALARHGFARGAAPKSPAELLARLKGMALDWWFDAQELTNRPRPTDSLWQDAEGLCRRDPFLPALPSKPDAGRERYAALVHWCEDCARASNTSPANQAFGAARKFVEHLAMVAQRAREYRPSSDKPDAWQDVAFDFAEAFIAGYDLMHLLTPAVCTEARRVYPPGAASIKLGASNKAAPVVPTMPASVVSGLAAYRLVTLGATPYPTVIEAVADELWVHFRNAVYAGRRHLLEPDLDRLIGEAKSRATARQIAQGKPAEPFGWGADLDELKAKETRAEVRARLGIKTYGDSQDLMMREWKAQDQTRGESALYLLRCDPINFPDLRMQLVREAEAVIAAASKPSGPAIDSNLLQRLEAGIAAVHSIGSNFDASMARVGRVIESLGARDDDDDNADTKPPALPAKAEAIDEYDAALLAFLNRNPSLRRRISDVLPEKGPQDRKAVAKRLRKLADRTPPLVDYPKDGRSGVVILPAGAEALKRATAPTPR